MTATPGRFRLVESEGRGGDADLERIFECAGAAICTVSPDGRFLRVNQAFCDLTGHARDELLASSLEAITHEDHRAAEREAMDALLAGEAERCTQDERFLRRDGCGLWVRLTVSLARDARGAPDHFVMFAQNIEAERRAEQALRAREQQLRTIIEAVPVGVVVAEFPSGRIVAGNSAVEQLLRHPILYSKDVRAYEEWTCFHADGRQVRGEEHPLARMMLDGEERPSLDVNYRRGDGTFAWIRITGRPIRDAAGEISGGVVALVDIDEERKARDHAAEQLEAVRAQLIHASRVSAMGTMASTIAHEINQPLAAVAGCFSGTIARLGKGGDAAVADAIEWLKRGETITHQAGETIHRLRAMLARGESRRATVPLVRLVEDAKAIALAGASAAISYRQEIEPSTVVEGDPVQIQQVLINLMRNAVEAMAETDRRRLTVLARPAAGQIEIAVADSGPGIPDAVRASLFEPFLSSKPGGMGIGLSICRTIVEAHGGRISARETPGGGATFAFTVPAG